MKTTPKGPFLGVNNRLPDFALHKPKVGDFLRRAENVEITNAGTLQRRKATALLQAVSGIHSLYTTESGDRYAVIASALYEVTLPTYTQTLVSVLTSDDRMSYAEFNGSLYFSNGTDSGRITGGVLYPLALPTPVSPAVAALPASGTLFAGKYQVAVAYFNSATGEEGGVSPSHNFDLPADGGLRITLPAATAGATHINVYVSRVNGDVPFFRVSVATGTATADVGSNVYAREANQRYEAPLPAGELVFFNGTLYSIKGGTVFEGIPFRPGYYVPINQRDAEGGGVHFLNDVQVFAPAQNGVYIATTKTTHWFPGTRLTKTEMVQDILPYGGVPGTFFTDKKSSKVGWFSTAGVVVADITGQADAVMADNIDLTAPASGVSSVFTDGGFHRVVSCGWCVNVENGAATSFSDYDFTSISGNYGTKADGIHDLLATGPVAYDVGLGKENFGTEVQKHLPAAYLGGSSESPMQLRVQTPQHDYTYPARSCSDEVEIHRVDPGKGLRANWYDLSLVGEDDFTLASVSFAPTASTRRI